MLEQIDSNKWDKPVLAKNYKVESSLKSSKYLFPNDICFLFLI